MSDESDLLKDLRAAMTQTAAQHLRNVENLNALLRGGRPPANREVRDVEARLYDVLFDAARLHLSVYNQLLSLSSSYADYYVEGLRRLTRPMLGPAAPAERRQIIEVTGALGEEVPVRFTLDHRLASPEEIALAVSDFRPTDAGPARAACVKREMLPDRLPSSAAGRRFAETPTGRRWTARLARCELVRRGRMLWQGSVLNMFEENPDALLPSALLDAVMGAIVSEALPALLARLLEQGYDDAGPVDS